MHRFFFACLVATFPLFLQADTGICLTMVVKNDQAVIKRCLKSVVDVVDCISICDAGSSDKTIEIVKKFMKKNGIPGQIHQQEWKSFAHNRTESIKAAQKALKAAGFTLEQSYLLALDADMTLDNTHAFKKNALEADAYLLSEHSKALGYYIFNAHLLRASLLWTHQDTLCGSWVYKGPHQVAKLFSMSIENHDDGNLTAEQRDIKLITQAVKDDPNNTCNILRLAHLLRCQKNYEKAIEGYKSYLKLGGDKEEIWFSKYLIGKCYEEMNKWEEASKWYTDAYQYNPQRRDPLLKIATHYRKSDQNAMAYIFAKRGSLMTPASDQIYFEESPLFDYRFDEELSIAGYYANAKEEGFTAASNLLIKKGVPWATKYQTYRNIIFYTTALKMSHFFPITLDLPLIRKGYEERYHPMNPSILKTDEGYQVICRTVNYTQKGAISSNFKTIDPEGIFRTRNFLLRYDWDFELLSQQEIIEKLPRRRIFNWVEGMEDCRLVEIDKATWFTCTTSDTNPTGQRQISLCKLSDEKRGKEIKVEKLIPLLGPDPHRCEKNWLPFVKDGAFNVLYSCSPFNILKPDLETGNYEISFHYEPQHDFSGFRGSAAPIEYKDGYLMMIHETVQFEDQSRNYLHRFVYLDKDFMIQQISRPFIFFHLGIEFCCSMTLDHSGKELVMAIGIEDCQAYLGFVKLDTIESLLKPLPPN